MKEGKVDVFVNIVSLSFDERTNNYILEIKTSIDMTKKPQFKNFWIDRQKVNLEWGKEEKFSSSIFRYKIHELSAESIHELNTNLEEYIEWLKQEISNRFTGYKKEKHVFNNFHLSYSDGFFEVEQEEVQFETK